LALPSVRITVTLPPGPLEAASARGLTASALEPWYAYIRTEKGTDCCAQGEEAAKACGLVAGASNPAISTGCRSRTAVPASCEGSPQTRSRAGNSMAVRCGSAAPLAVWLLPWLLCRCVESGSGRAATEAKRRRLPDPATKLDNGVCAAEGDAAVLHHPGVVDQPWTHRSLLQVARGTAAVLGRAQSEAAAGAAARASADAPRGGGRPDAAQAASSTGGGAGRPVQGTPLAATFSEPLQFLRLGKEAAASIVAPASKGSGLVGPLVRRTAAIIILVSGACLALYSWFQDRRCKQCAPRLNTDLIRRMAEAAIQNVHPPSQSGPAPGSPPDLELDCPRLCQGLVVPSGRSCTLAVKPPLARDSARVVEIYSPRGVPMLEANVCRPLRWPRLGRGAAAATPRGAGPGPAITLRTLERIPVLSADVPEEGYPVQPPGSVLAMCFAGKAADGHRCMTVCSRDGQVIGSLSRKGNGIPYRYLFSTSCRDDWMALDGIFAHHAVLISNRHLELLADTQPCHMAGDGFYNLRCYGGVDVGLAVLCLLAVDEMEVPDAARMRAGEPKRQRLKGRQR